jgi:hypothetical protein
MNDWRAARRCAAMVGSSLGMSASDAGALKPEPSGLSMKMTPKRRFQRFRLRESAVELRR